MSIGKTSVYFSFSNQAIFNIQLSSINESSDGRPRRADGAAGGVVDTRDRRDTLADLTLARGGPTLAQGSECDAADVAVLHLRVLSAHDLQAVVRRLVVQLTDVAHARLQVPLLVRRVLLEVGGPGRSPSATGHECEVDGGGADKRGQVLEHLVVLQRQLDQVVGEQLGRRARHGGDVGDLGEALEKDEGVRRRQLEVEPGEH
eukprot:scaffold128693_cov68-Phaeocystis_antarctica.AAC.17